MHAGKEKSKRERSEFDDPLLVAEENIQKEQRKREKNFWETRLPLVIPLLKEAHEDVMSAFDEAIAEEQEKENARLGKKNS